MNQTWKTQPGGVVPSEPMCDGNHTIPFLPNDGGRFQAGFQGTAGDCVTRAICIATGLPYREVYDFLAHGNQTQRRGRNTKEATRYTKVRTARHGIFTGRKWFKDYMKDIGFVWTPYMVIGVGSTMRLIREDVPLEGRHVLKLSRHLTALVDGVINDTYDPQRYTVEVKDGEQLIRYRAVYGVWTWSG